MNDFIGKEKENMREILFRGKCELGECWKIGSLVIREDTYGNVQYEIVTGQSEKYVVIPDTIGQYTGLKDKNDVKIFEGDILESQIGDKNIWYVCFEDGAFVIHMVNSYQLSAYQRKRTCLQNYCCSDDIALYDLKVIGNIHDNPELLNNN